MPTPKIKVIRVTRDVTSTEEAVDDWHNEFKHGNYYPHILSLSRSQHCIVRFPCGEDDYAWIDILERQAELNKRLASGNIVISVDQDDVWAPT
jgi:hypothetical protein